MTTVNSEEDRSVVEWVLKAEPGAFPQPSIEEHAQILLRHLDQFTVYLKHLVSIPFKNQTNALVAFYQEPIFLDESVSLDTKCLLLIRHESRDEEKADMLLLLTNRGELFRWDHPQCILGESGTIQLIDEDGLSKFFSEIPISSVRMALPVLSGYLTKRIEKDEHRLRSLKALLKHNEEVQIRLGSLSLLD